MYDQHIYSCTHGPRHVRTKARFVLVRLAFNYFVLLWRWLATSANYAKNNFFEYHSGKARGALEPHGSPARDALLLEGSPCLRIQHFGPMVAMVALLLSIMIF
jgi:hypothetical protein